MKCKGENTSVYLIILCGLLRHCGFWFIFFASITFFSSGVIKITTNVTFPIIWIWNILLAFVILRKDVRELMNTFTAYSLLFLHLLHSVR